MVTIKPMKIPMVANLKSSTDDDIALFDNPTICKSIYTICRILLLQDHYFLLLSTKSSGSCNFHRKISGKQLNVS